MSKPFLKWAGSKTKVMPHLAPHFPDCDTLIEPFAGSCSVFLNTNYQKNIISDINPHLIDLFNIVKEEGELFVKYVKAFFNGDHNTSERYYANRSLFNSTNDTRLKSALFVYLNRHCFNGLCRYNSKGEFNVPMGEYKVIYFPEQELLQFHIKAQKAIFSCCSFEDTIAKADKNSFVYCDPPYVPLSGTSYFTDYVSNGFNNQHHEKLANLAINLQKQGVKVIISNHDTEYSRQLYHTANIIPIEVQRSISSKGSERKRAKEIIAVF